MKTASFSYLTIMGETVDDITISGSVMVEDDATEEQIQEACKNEAARILREETEQVLSSWKLVKQVR